MNASLSRMLGADRSGRPPGEQDKRDAHEVAAYFASKYAATVLSSRPADRVPALRDLVVSILHDAEELEIQGVVNFLTR